ncbi:hypothetical protein GCM10027344_36590 [Spelaeicoccus albus]|nr:alpha/beta hydrolase [Spelaeicoccus albus]
MQLTSGAGDVSIHYWTYGVEAGDAPASTIVMIHGFRGDHHGMQLIAEALPGHRVIVPDLPGFGLSGLWPAGHGLDGFTDFLSAFIDHLKLPEPPVLLGHSFGSIICAEFAATFHDATSHLVLINPISSPALQGPRAAATKLTIGYYRASAALPEPLGLRLLRNRAVVRLMSVAMAKTRNPELRQYIHAQHDAHFSSFADRTALLDAFRTSVSHTAADRADEIRTPTLVLAADRDDISPLTDQQRLHDRIHGSEFVVVAGVGHLIHYEAPALAATIIEEFLA